MAAYSDIPAYLRLDEDFGHLGSFRQTRVWSMATGLAEGFAIEIEVALVAILSGIAHTMGGMIRTSTTFASVDPPFSLLVVTPEPDPIWPEVPVRFLTHEFGVAMRQSLETYLTQKGMEASTTGENPSDTSLKNAAELAERVWVDGMVERIATNSVRFPFPRSLIDSRVLLSTPAVGLRRAFRHLEPIQKHQLEMALSTNSRIIAPDGEKSSGVPAFYWQTARAALTPLLTENPWLVSVPFVVVETTKPGLANLDTSLPCVAELHRRCHSLFGKRQAAGGRSRSIHTSAKIFLPYRAFLEEAQAYTTGGAHLASLLPPRRVAELGLKLTSVLTVLEGKQQPGELEARLGLELAKRLSIRRQQILNASMPADVVRAAPDLDGLNSRERAVYLKIVERGGLGKSELSRSFHRMRKQERDRILASLMSRNLVEIREDVVVGRAA